MSANSDASKPVVSIRMEPQLKYLATLAARKQRRSLSGYIAWVVEQSVKEDQK